MGEAKKRALRLEFNRKVKLEFHGAKMVATARYVYFQMAEVAVPGELFALILSRINGLRPLAVT
ncbi:MAG: hypothetical protein HY280_10600 [Nitrospinae bacterium]|nr:hypothetical protein [Nitrospinota bacterium]